MLLSRKTILVALATSLTVASAILIYFAIAVQQQSSGNEHGNVAERDQNASSTDGQESRVWGVGEGHPDGDAPGIGQNNSNEDQVVVSESLHAFDVMDERKLVGFSDNVFLGRIVEELGTEEIPRSGPDHEARPMEVEGPRMPRTEFSVEVLRNIKGNLSGTVTVSQTGGWVEYTARGRDLEEGIEPGDRVRELTLADGDPLLDPGDAYLFVTGHNERGGYHQITTPGHGNVPANSPQKRANLVERFTDARANQIDPFADNPSFTEHPFEE